MLIALLMMRTGELHRQKKSTRERGHLVAGLKYVWRTDDLRRPLIAMAVVFTFAFNFAVFVPLLAERSPSTAMPARSACCRRWRGWARSWVRSRWRAASPHPKLRDLAWWAVACGVSLVLAGAAPVLWLAALAMIPMGFTIMAFMITGNTMLQLTSVPQARGRVMALYGIVFLGSTPIGAPIAGVIGEHLGAQTGLWLSGLVAAGLGVALLGLGRRHARVGAPRRRAGSRGRRCRLGDRVAVNRGDRPETGKR